MEQELQRQVENAMMMGCADQYPYQAQGNYPAPPKSEISFNLTEADHATEREYYHAPQQT